MGPGGGSRRHGDPGGQRLASGDQPDLGQQNVTPFFWALCCWFLLRGLRRRRPIDWALAGLAGGLGEYSFYGTRLLISCWPRSSVYLLVVHWREGWRYLGHIGLGVLGYLAGFGPLLAYFLTNPDLYFGRGQAGLVWDHIPATWPISRKCGRRCGRAWP